MNFFYKKFYLFVFLLFMIIGCSNTNYKWQSTQTAISNSYKLQTGDIIVKDKLITDPMSWLGHSSVMISDTHIGDFPMPGSEYYTISVNAWLNEPNREVIVLRYPYFNQKFKEAFLKNVEKYGHGKYKTSFFKQKDSDFYCSKFVWFLYYKTAKDLGYTLDLDSNKGIIVFPYNFLNSPHLKQVNL
ncbi:YiiX/YebB-like N1pC/P60 family cysteine hydrolase [Cetobacterium somerae]|uniref:YiiX/YebB-like N1pC/P60 family cysteine hydrolase n=1 Tax=Cetobacterium sp. NK01 TaxID=2993530 RepID=UPI002116CCA5|nr:YiiX/YebB-like N1pC/P60 family cysteine hydrolase [Cetobacterium sp. NK01]MCQ8211101.1 YiiX/YebB-like N1pC/P60 family cysteine hydrolase [Cetobacterium sp. NK01]